MLRIAVSLLILTCCAEYLQARPDSARFVHFDITNGLPSNNVYSVVKDSYGYTWFATEKGAVKYNGYNFSVYNTGNGLPEDDIWELTPDKRGRVWVHTFGYQFGYLKNGSYNALTTSSPERILTAYYLSEAGGLTYFYSGNDSQGDFFFIADGVVKKFPFDRGRGLQKKKGVIDSYMGNNLSFYIMDKEENIYAWDILKGGDRYKFLFKADQALKFGFSYRRCLSPKEELYSFRFNEKTLHKYNFKEATIEEPLTLKMMGGSDDENIYSLCTYFYSGNYNENSALITNSHIYTIDKNFKFIKREAVSEVVPTRSQLAFYILDRFSNKWFTTKADGVWILPAENSLFSLAIENTTLSISTYVGTVAGRSYWWNRTSRVIYQVEKSKISEQILMPEGTAIRSVTGNEGHIFIGGESGIYKYSIADKRMAALGELYASKVKIEDEKVQHRVILHRKGGAFEYVNHIRNLNGNLYTLGSQYALQHTIKDDSVITTIKFSERFIGMEMGWPTIAFFNNQKMVVRNEETGKETLFDIDAFRRLGIGSVKQIKRDKFNNWYFLGNEKLLVCNSDLKKFGELDMKVNLRDAQMTVWENKLIFAGVFGVGYADIKGPGSWSGLKVAPNYTTGKPHYQLVSDMSVDKDGFVILKTNKGVFDFTFPELSAVASLDMQKEGALQMMLEQPYESVINGNDTLAIEQSAQKLKLDVISYNGKGIPKYFYKVHGSLVWEESESGEILVGNLAPGKYHKIACKVKDDLWASKVYSVCIYRYPMWWQTSTWKRIFWVFGGVGVLILGLLTVLITRYYVAKKNKRKRALTELELQAIHSQINPHFIFNTLSAALFFINRKRLDDAYTHVSKFSQLLRSYLKSSQDRYVVLSEEIKMLKNYIELQQIRFEEKFGYRIEIDNKLPLDNIRIPSLLLQPLVENAINHGLFHKENGGSLLLKFEQGKDTTELICTIDDNGVGREAARKINEESRTRDSYGTKLTHQLLDVFKQYENLDIKLDYKDKVFPETGTIVTLILKNIKYVT